MKSSFSLFELILTLIISSIIVVFSTKYLKDLALENRYVQNSEIAKIDLRSVKIFIQKNIKDINKISFSNNILYFENEILIKNIKDFKLTNQSNIVEIFVNYDDKIVQTWKFLK